MAIFNPSDGSLTGTGSDGYAFSWKPPFTSQTQIDGYVQALQSLQRSNVVTTAGYIKIPGNLGNNATLSAIRQVNELPAVQVYSIGNPPTFAVVYTDASGISSFAYKDDPANLIQLVQGGSMIQVLPAPVIGTAIAQSNGNGNAAAAAGGGLGFICSCLSSISFLIIVLVVVLLLLNRKNVGTQ
jgi:hypothetical protein